MPLSPRSFAKVQPKLQDVIVSGRAQGMQFMDDAIWALLEKGIVSPHESFMKAIDKSRFRPFLSQEEEALGNAAGSVRNDEKRVPGTFVSDRCSHVSRAR